MKPTALHFERAHAVRALAFATLAIGLAGASQAAVSVRTQDEAAIKPGMTQEQVGQLLGRPAQRMHFGMSDTTTWTYQAPQAYGMTVFDVDFDANGKVVSAEEITTDRD